MQGVIFLLILGQLYEPVGAFGIEETYGAACVDLDRDNVCDVITASNQGVGYYHNRGAAAFDPRRELCPTAPIPARAVVAGDLNNDSRIDLFVATTGQDFLLINSGDNLSFSETYTPFRVELSRSAALADYDLDGDLDILVAGAVTRLYTNDGAANFTLRDSFPAGYAISWADYNADSRPDFALAGSDTVFFYTNLVSGFIQDTFIAANTPRGVCWFDSESDGFLEVAVADSAAANFIIDPQSSFAVTTLGTLVEPTLSVAAGDFDGQPGVDLLFVNYGTQSRIYRGPDFTLQADDTVSYGTREQRSVALADLDDANGSDAVVVGRGGNCWLRSRVPRINKIILNLFGRRDVVPSLSNTMAAGAAVRLYDGATLKETWDIAAGTGCAGQDAPQKIFPVPDPTNYRLVISWPRSGVVDSLALDTFDLPAVIYAYEDLTPPTPPSNLECTSHDTVVWSNKNQVSFKWEPGSDEGSGLKGYSVSWSNDTADMPDFSLEANSLDTSGTFASDCEGRCYFFISSVDSVGNVSMPARSAPLKLDFSEPVSVEPFKPVSGAFVNDSLIEYQWIKGSDIYSKIATYKLEVSDRDNFLIILDSATLSPPPDSEPLCKYQSLKPLAERSNLWYYWRVVTADSAGNVDIMPTDSFQIDLTAPYVELTFPVDGDTGVSINPRISIQFSEQMFVSDTNDAASAINPENYRIVKSETSKPYSFYVTIDSTFPTDRLFYLNLNEELSPQSNIRVSVLATLQDRAGNRIRKDTTWVFVTGNAADKIGPRIESVIMEPNPTLGGKKIAVTAYANDSAYVSNQVDQCLYWIDDDTVTHSMIVKPISFKATCLDTLDLNVYPLDINDHVLKFQAIDASKDKNKGPYFYDTLTVNSTPSPIITPLIQNDTNSRKMRVGDTLELVIESSQTLADVTIRLFHSDSLYKEKYIDHDPGDMVTYIPLEGIPAGIVTLTVIGKNQEGEVGAPSRTFTLEGIALLTKERAFAAPNPASQELGIYFIPGESVTATLRAYTIDGQLVWDPEPIQNALGGQRWVFQTDVSIWPVGIYVFVINVESADGRTSTVKKTFAVVR